MDELLLGLRGGRPGPDGPERLLLLRAGAAGAAARHALAFPGPPRASEPPSDPPWRAQVCSGALLLNMGLDPSPYFPYGVSGVLTNGVTGGLLSYLLFWTLFYDICHLY